MRAYCSISSSLENERESVVAGLVSSGYDLMPGNPSGGREGDVLVIWNRWGAQERIAAQFERDGGTVVVAENPYVGYPDYMSLAIGSHNGGGMWRHPAEDDEEFAVRLRALEIDAKPLRADGDHILVCPSRLFGQRGHRQPADWVARATGDIKRLTGRPIRIRNHPGDWKRKPPRVSIEDDLRGAYACVIWSSSAGVRALIHGVPVVQYAPQWVCESAALRDLDSLEKIERSSWEHARDVALRRMAWAQWRLEEVAGGEAFRCLMRF